MSRTQPTPTDYANDPYHPRVVRAVDELLREKGHVAPVDVFLKLDLLGREAMEDWRRGRAPFLERAIRCNLGKASRILRLLALSAQEKKLKPSTTVYMRWGKGPRSRLRFTKTGDANLEAAYARHFVPVRSEAAACSTAPGQSASPEPHSEHVRAQPDARSKEDIDRRNG